MSTADGVIDLKYKTGVSDDVICRILQRGDVPVDLSTFDSVVFNINDSEGHSFSVPCVFGNGSYSAAQGGVTINFSETELANEGEYECEFVATRAGKLTRIPSDDVWYLLAIYQAVQVTP